MFPYLKCEFNVSVKIQQKCMQSKAKVFFQIQSQVDNQAEFDLQLKQMRSKIIG
jgi:hypothetical protein